MKLRSERLSVQTDTIIWETTIQHSSRTFSIPVFHTITKPLDRAHIPIVNLNGIGEGAFSASVAAQELGPNVVSVILPLQETDLELTKETIDAIARELPARIARYTLEKTGGYFTTVHMIARSQGGAIGIHGVYSHPELFSKLALIMPFGLNKEQLGSSAALRRRTILIRLARAAAGSNHFDTGHLRSSREIAGYMKKAFLEGRLFSSLDAALTFDMGKEIRAIAKRMPVGVFLGKSDPLFPATEIRPKLAGSDVHLYDIEGGHATPGSRRGRQQLRQAYNWIKEETTDQ